MTSTSASWHIRLARKDDADRLPEIERAAGSLFRDEPQLAAIADGPVIKPDEHRRLIARGHCLVAAQAEGLVGFLATEPQRRELYIRELSVLPSHQRQGIGAALLRGSAIDARNAGFAFLTLTTYRDVPWNAPFYARLGFVEAGDSQAHPHLAERLEQERATAPQGERRIAMVRLLN